MRRFSEPKTDAVVGEGEFIDWIAAYANEHVKAPARGLVTGNSGSLCLTVRMSDEGGVAKYRVFERPSAKHKRR